MGDLKFPSLTCDENLTSGLHSHFRRNEEKKGDLRLCGQTRPGKHQEEHRVHVSTN